MLRQLLAIGSSAILSYGLSQDLTVWAAPSLSREAKLLKQKTDRLRGDMSIDRVLKIMGRPVKKMPIDRYIWDGSNYTLTLWFRPLDRDLIFLETENYAARGNIDREIEEMAKKVGNLEKGIPYEEVVKQLGFPGKKDKTTPTIKYFWRAKESVAFVVFQGAKIHTYAYYDTPKDYFNRDLIPVD
jgi:hypothetical protein